MLQETLHKQIASHQDDSRITSVEDNLKKMQDEQE